MTLPPALIAIVLVLLVVNTLGILALAADVGRLSLRLDPARGDLPLVPNEGLRRGDALPELRPKAFPSGETINLGSEPVLFVFISSGCAPCRELWPALVRFGKQLGSQFRVLAVIAGDPLTFVPDAESAPAGLAVVFDSAGEIGTALKVRRTPFAYLIVDGIVKGKGVVNRFEHLVTLTQGHSLPAPPSWSDPGDAGTARLADEVN